MRQHYSISKTTNKLWFGVALLLQGQK